MHDGFMPIVFLNVDDAVATMLLFIAILLPQGSSCSLAHPIHVRSLQSRGPS